MGEEKVKPKFALLNASKVRWVNLELLLSSRRFNLVVFLADYWMFTLVKIKEKAHRPRHDQTDIIIIIDY